ncbi:protein aardvark [Anaeramoeba ignava]|uniref:Protein aardvark n=1 Tax=Anaeramoeba ignava TaxID=1746090 RepID=A0A9Q0LD21_ANAIG|nr:protein aardvark [Anaeramoeba ignava]
MFCFRKFSQKIENQKSNSTNGTELIIQLMKNIKNENLQQYSISILDNISMNSKKQKEFQEQISKFEGIELIIKSMINFPNNEKIIEHSNQLLLKNCINNEENQTQFKESKVIKTIFETLKNFLKDENFQEKGFQILLNISNNKDDKEKQLTNWKSQRIEIIIQILNKFLKEEIIEQGFIILETLSGGFKKIKLNSKRETILKKKEKEQKIANLKGIEPIIIKAMNKFPKNQFIQEKSLLLLININLDPKNGDEMHELKGNERILKAMNNFPNEESIQEKGCWILQIFFYDPSIQLFFFNFHFDLNLYLFLDKPK